MDKELLERKIFSIISGNKNEYNSVLFNNDTVVKYIIEKPSRYLLGVKNTDSINRSFIKQLTDDKEYLWHTIDKTSHKGRAIDNQLINPLTGNMMTGSSSGSAINVFLGINDISICTDGGGSTIYPAMSLNLYSFLASGILDKPSKVKKSTDNINFSVGTGFITRDIDTLKVTLEKLDIINDIKNKNALKCCVIGDVLTKDQEKEISSLVSISPHKEINTDERLDLINSIKDIISKNDIIITKEKYIDYNHYGDSVIGCHGSAARENQKTSNKKFGKVINMLNLNALTVPIDEISSGYVIICKNDKEIIKKVFEIGNILKVEQNKLIDTYFRTLSEDNGIIFSV